jgi:Fe-S-cluster-containing dehydrogenase component
MKRRDFFKMMGIASGAALAACNANNADRKLLPYLVPPEEGIIPGIPHYKQSTCMECPANCGLKIKIRDDKPVKLEGNPDHPVNKGSLCMRGQASLARLYHPERFKQPMLKQADGSFKAISWDEAAKVFGQALEEAKQKNLRRVFIGSHTTGSLGKLVESFCSETGIERHKDVEFYHHGAIRKANETAFGISEVSTFHFDKADVLLTVGADILDTCLSPVEWTRQVSDARKRNHLKWFHAEPYLSLTGASADKRMVCAPGSEAMLTAFLLRNVTHRKPLPSDLMTQIPDIPKDRLAKESGLEPRLIDKLVRALNDAQMPLIVTGGPLSSKHNGSLAATYTALLQWALGMVGETVDFSGSFNHDSIGSPTELFLMGNDSQNGKAGLVIFSRFHLLNTMPGMVELFEKVPFKVALAQVPSTLTESCHLVLPLSDPLESWGDAEPRRGLKSIIQPVLNPLHDTKSDGDALLFLSGKNLVYRDYLATQWQGMEEAWINDGFKTEAPETRTVGLLNAVKLNQPEPLYKKDCLYIVPSLRTFDGRSSDIALLGEIPDPLSSVSYGKFLSISLATATARKLVPGDVAELTLSGEGGVKITLPVQINPALPEGVMTLSVDGLSGLMLMLERGTGEFISCLEGVSINPTGRRVTLPALAGAVETGKRSILPHLEKRYEHGHHHEYKRYTLYEPHEYKEYRWGMIINLDACTGCSACVAACYIENNVPVVGKEEHLRGREMAWLRIEPYYNDPEKPEFLPMMCQQCECAPCETVCPVYATYHNEEGLNAQVYNRCVGTRYCANNCPYKARRFNWFEYENKLPLYTVSNPDLSVRPKGVMEKCSFCIQRIRFAKDRAKDEKRLVKDGELVPACAQTCPANAITFGNLMDPESRVSKLAKAAGAFRVQELLGTEPAVYYVSRSAAKEDHNKKEHNG